VVRREASFPRRRGYKTKKRSSTFRRVTTIYCFVWSILAHLHPAQANPHRIQNYTRYASELNLDGLTFPLHIKDISRFERQNPDIAIHCMAVDSKDNSFSILYLIPHVYKRLHTITLLILDNERDPQKTSLRLREEPESTDCPSQQVWASIARLSQLSAGVFVRTRSGKTRALLPRSQPTADRLSRTGQVQTNLRLASLRTPVRLLLRCRFREHFETPRQRRQRPDLSEHARNGWILFTQNDAARKLSDTTHHIFGTERHRKISRTHFCRVGKN